MVRGWVVPQEEECPKEGVEEEEAWSAKGRRREGKGDGDQYQRCMTVVV